MFPFLFTAFLAADDLIQTLRARNQWAAAAVGLACTGGTLAFGIFSEEMMEGMVKMPNPAVWTNVLDDYWSSAQTSYVPGDETVTYLKPAARSEDFATIMVPHIIVAALFLHGVLKSIRQTGG
jgi:hypothetical protein